MHYPKIEFLRRVKGFTQKQMAMDLNIDQAEYQRIESGQKQKIDEATINKIALLLGTTKEELTNPQPYVFYVINNDSSSQNNAPFGHQQFNINDELLKIIKDTTEQMVTLVENNQKLTEANLALVEKITTK
jgi:transcriptional regulator with XRE-family HTH domain